MPRSQRTAGAAAPVALAAEERAERASEGAPRAPQGLPSSVPPVLFELRIPALPDKALVTNSRDGTLHWHQRSRLVADARERVRPLVLSALMGAGWVDRNDGTPLLEVPVFLSWVLYVDSWRCPDTDGMMAALKPWLDELVRPEAIRGVRFTGLLPNDGPRWVRGTSVRLVRDPALAPMTVLKVYAEEE